ncbi:2OG-Fe(II) oxygenase [Pseudomonas fluorescens]|uniref:2OG-Fe(II) oxygenase n=1 Tax=Pseudomonas fluorescens TaxID=294 RepID=UPI001906F06F|nr:2OG-Fe(II) oxygenase [Pseudomonas fluorescens]MBD8092039.1 2OG-Fe(II) oxygenase [Pseudomonas fluorescens]MBD8718207.1 2OG-Fe(II) oxygenase [Pseudomonas fluorescens]
MTTLAATLERLDWQSIGLELDREGFIVLPGLFGLEAPGLFGNLLNGFYPPLAQVSNQWNDILQLPYRFPPQLPDFHAQCRAVGQQRELSRLTCLHEDEHLALGQDAEGEYLFPFQLVGVLSAPGEDFTGGEFILTEQRPRMQSRPMVLPLQHGDLAVITTAHRPFKGRKGYYRVNIKHAISPVRSGERRGFLLSFHFGPGAPHDS